MIELKNISKAFPVGKERFFALKDICLHVEKGEFIAVCGASGSGKTTLLNIIGCMDSCSEGAYLLNGTDVSAMPDSRRSHLRNAKIGFVLQDFGLVNDRSALFNVMLPLLLGDTPFHRIRRKARNALKSVGLEAHAHKKVSLLSGGERQRVAIARAIVNEPELLLADEPTGQLDSRTGKQIMERISALNRQGVTILMVTHDPAIAAFADRVVTLADGMVLSGTEESQKEKRE